LQKIIIESNYEYKKSEIEKDIQKLMNIAQSYIKIDSFLNAVALNKDKFRTFYKKDLEIESLNKTSKDAVTLSTIHSAKGLVWRNVIIPGLSDGLFPNPFFCEFPQDPEKTRNKYNENLKTLYVAITRSSKRLILIYPLGYDNQYGKTFNVNKSRFLKKIGL
jgi:DNA helicase-2/ATP-dependent DNA helicase PcrA